MVDAHESVGLCVCVCVYSWKTPTHPHTYTSLRVNVSLCVWPEEEECAGGAISMGYRVGHMLSRTLTWWANMG